MMVFTKIEVQVCAFVCVCMCACLGLVLHFHSETSTGDCPGAVTMATRGGGGDKSGDQREGKGVVT